jgi:hypothetical protein
MWAGRAPACGGRSQAAAKPAMAGRFSVPPRRWRSCRPASSAAASGPCGSAARPRPWGRRTCAPTPTSGRPRWLAKSSRDLPASCVASTCSQAPQACASVASSASGMHTPVSLLAPITLTSATSSRSSARACCRSSRPCASTPMRSTGVPSSASRRASASRPGCSTADSTSRRPPLAAPGGQGAQHGVVVGLGGAAGEDQLGCPGSPGRWPPVPGRRPARAAPPGRGRAPTTGWPRHAASCRACRPAPRGAAAWWRCGPGRPVTGSPSWPPAIASPSWPPATASPSWPVLALRVFAHPGQRVLQRHALQRRAPAAQRGRAPAAASARRAVARTRRCRSRRRARPPCVNSWG